MTDIVGGEVIDALGAASTRIVDDYENRRPPFKAVTGVTEDITAELESGREKALFLTLTTSLNRQRDAEQLYSKFERLYYDEHWIFEPETLVEEQEFEDLAELFESEGTRFGRQDAKVWYEIARTLYIDYDSNPMNLLESQEYNTEQLEEHVKVAKGDTRFFKHGKSFPAHRGDKIRPVWIRLISNQVHPLGAQGGSDVAVDTHIRKVTNRLVDTDFSSSKTDKEQIRRFWGDVCSGQPISPVEIDGPLWFIERDWGSWGGNYLRDQLKKEGSRVVDIGVSQKG